jgi:predicted ATPase/class 3 adenylate cyclase
MRCPNCGAENPAKNKFCGECGTNLQTVTAQDRIDMVRKDIPESLVKKILLTKDTIQKERRDVTVIFADISGFTTMSEKLDPEELTNIMNECFRKLGTMIYRYEGIIDKFIGDCIMAIFGAPVTHQDDPERAILACLDMQLALKEINEHLEPSLKKLEIHSGVNTGQVIAGKVGSDLQMEYTVMGDTVNVAQRLKDRAPRGSVLVGPETYNRTRHAFDFMPMDPVQLKGKVALIRPYEIVGKKAGSEYGLSALRSDLIGRAQELTLLEYGYSNLKNKKSSIFTIKGEIGVGKSRLLYEFKKYLSIKGSHVTILEGRGVSYERTIPYKTFTDILRNALVADESHAVSANSESTTKEKLKALLGAEADDIVPYIYTLLNFALTEKELKKVKYLDSHSLQLQIFLAVSTLFEKLNAQQPIVFIIDDIQWIDNASLDIINFLLSVVKKHAIAFYLSYRIGDLTAIKHLLNTVQTDYSRYHTEIALANLTSEHSAQLIESLLGKDIDSSLEEFIIKKSEGNPFFIEEIVRNLVESGTAFDKKQTHRIQIPGSIDAAVSSRIDGLKKETKYLLRIAALIGRSFPHPLLKEIVKEKDILKHIDELESLEFLVKTKQDHQVYYTFRHTLFQEVAYNTLLKSERVIYHKVIAETIEQKFKDRIKGYDTTLAYHYQNCNNKEKTIEYSIKAGDGAAKLFANEEALTHYNNALNAAQDDYLKASVLEKIATIESTVGRLKMALQHYENAQNCYTDKIDKARTAGNIAHLLTQMGEIDNGLAMMNKAIDLIKNKTVKELAELKFHFAHDLLELKGETNRAEALISGGITVAKKTKNKMLEAAGMRMKGQLLMRRGKNDEALTALKQAIQIYESQEAEHKTCELLFLMGVICRSQGNIEKAIEYVKQALTQSRRIGDQLLLGNAYNNLGVYHGLIGDNDTAIEYYEKNLEIKERIGDVRGQALVMFNIAILYDDSGAFDKGIEHFTRSIALFEKVNDLRSLIYAYPALAQKYIEKGDTKKAKALLDKALGLANTTEDPILISEATGYYALYYLDIDKPEKALEMIDRTAELLKDSKDQSSWAETYIIYAQIYLHMKDPKSLTCADEAVEFSRKAHVKRTEIMALRIRGTAHAFIRHDFEKGIKEIKESIKLAEEVGLVLNMAHGLAALGEVLLENNKRTEARTYLEKARKIFADAHFTTSLEKVDKLLQH